MLNTDSTQTYYPSAGKWWLVFLVCAAFFLIGLWMISDKGPDREPFKGYFCVVVFGLGLFVSSICLLPGSGFLRLTSDGMYVRAFWRTKSYSWLDIDCFGVAQVIVRAGHGTQRHRMVGFNFSAAFKKSGKARFMQSVNAKLSGFEAALPDNYGMDYAELAAILNTWREKYGSATDAPLQE